MRPEGAVASRIVVGVDMSPSSREALQWARLLAGPLDAEVVVVHAFGLLETMDAGPVPPHSARAQIAASLDRDWCAPFRTAQLPYRSQINDGSAVDVLHRVVEHEQADLLVLGRRGATADPARALGSTTLHVLEDTRTPTLVVPGVEAARRHRPGDHPGWHILVGVDGSAPSLRALGLAADLAQRFGGDLIATAVVEATAEGEEETLMRATSALADACRPAQQQGLPVRTVTRRGTPARVLLELAASFNIDLVAVGTRGVGAPGDPLLGSVSRKVVHHTDRPTLVVPTMSPAPPT